MITDDLDKTSFESRNSAITGSMRYFGLRLDDVPKWEAYDWNRYQTETLFLDDFHRRSTCLDAYLNTPKEWLGAGPMSFIAQDDKFKQVIENFVKQSSVKDNSKRKAAYQQLLTDLGTLADEKMDDIQQSTNFYTFDQERAKEELAYRQNIKKELDFIGNDLGKLGYKSPIGNK